jgi:hypothetical protein
MPTTFENVDPSVASRTLNSPARGLDLAINTEHGAWRRHLKRHCPEENG